MKIAGVFLAGLIGVVTVLILDATAGRFREVNIVVLIIIAGVIGLHGARFLIWAWLHKRYDISQSYPISSVFFPIIFVISLIKGVADLSWPKLVGLTLIVAGLIISEIKTHSAKD